MRSLLYTCTALAVMALPFGPITRTIKPKAIAENEQSAPRNRGKRANVLTVLRAEWAYLTARSSCAILAELNLTVWACALGPDQFGKVDQVAFPAPMSWFRSLNPVEVSAVTGATRPMIRTPLRPLARILEARESGENPDAIERENLRFAARGRCATALARAPKAVCWF